MIKKSVLDDFLARGFISRETYEKTLKTLPHEPALQWLERRLLGVGGSLVLAGVICFFAYNWAAMGLVLRFSLPLLGLLLCGAGAWKRGTKSALGASCCIGAGVFAGVFLAVYGQEFQTGAFVYELFGSWSLILFILAAASGVRWLWLMALYVLYIYIGSKYRFEPSYWPLLGAGLLAWAVTEGAVYLKKWPANFRGWIFVPWWVFITVYGLAFASMWNRYHADLKYWVLPVLCMLCGAAGIKLKSPLVLCGGAFSLAAFLCVFLVERQLVYGLFLGGLMVAVIFCVFSLLAWRGILYMRGKQ